MIDWELKKQFVKYINTRDYTNIEKFVLENIKDFDCQTWDMFAFANLVEENYSKDFFDKVKPYYKSFYNSSATIWSYHSNDVINQVLAPVPSYEEWWKLNQLLGKCYRFLRLTETKVEAIEKVKRGLVKEIDEVLK